MGSTWEPVREAYLGTRNGVYLAYLGTVRLETRRPISFTVLLQRKRFSVCELQKHLSFLIQREQVAGGFVRPYDLEL